MPLPVPVSAPELEELAARHGTPFQLYDERQMRANCRRLLSAFAPRFPGFTQFFAVKALPNPAVLRLLVAEGCGLDCSSVAELHIARALGVPGARTMFTGNFTSAEDLAVACAQGAVVNLDDASLVPALCRAAGRGGRCTELVSFRLNPGLGRTDSETKSNVLGGPTAKFGVPPDQILGAYRAARDTGATRFGMHMMTGSCVMNAAYWDETVSVLLDTVGRVRAELHIEFEFINIGGGLGIPYRPEQAPVDVEALAAQLARCVATRWAAVAGNGPSAPPPPRLFMENGRFMTGPFAWLVARCEARKDAWGQVYFGLDANMANLMRPGMYDAYHHITVPAREADDLRAPANVVGTLCENNDWFCRGRSLPASSAVGDLFVLHDTGAHAHSMGFQYNGKLRAPELLLREGSGGRVDVVREREEIPCLFDNCVMPADLAVGLPSDYPYLRSSRAAVGASGARQSRAALLAVSAVCLGLATAFALRLRGAARA